MDKSIYFNSFESAIVLCRVLNVAQGFFHFWRLCNGLYAGRAICFITFDRMMVVCAPGNDNAFVILTVKMGCFRAIIKPKL